ncbi:hypothetical protein EVAR_67049_1 [Eumeta japonica]|uniref:Reverse transcriptase RNase H-like domain-containing protein n=1 Tax=Eumeta variegata TaxID=151549 RepID=A0A4C2A9M4_EUMVA|nr:hypothetical protein EVAR_67049_1 [Eumeta japonica]
MLRPSEVEGAIPSRPRGFSDNRLECKLDRTGFATAATGNATWHRLNKINAELTKEAECNLTSSEFYATSTSNKSSGKREGAAAVNQLRGGQPLSDEAIRHLNTGNASGEALGASLMQREKELKEMHPEAYASRKFSNLEKKYSAPME